MKEETERLIREAAELPFSEILRVTGELSSDELTHMAGAPNWSPEVEAVKYRLKYFILKLREARQQEAKP